MPSKAHNSLRSLVFVSVLLASLFAFALGPDKAFASACRTDPVIVLNNGAQLQLAASIGTTYSNVQRVTYNVHAPVGSSVLLIVYTDNPLGSKEVVHYYADSQSNSYSVDTVVSAWPNGSGVTASGILVNLLHITLASGRASGVVNQHVLMSLHR